MIKKRGFTLIEVLVVIIIIAIIAGLAVPSYRRSRIESQNKAAIAKLVELANAARLYNEDAVGGARVAGEMCLALAGFTVPVRLFIGTPNDVAIWTNATNPASVVPDWNQAFLKRTGWNNLDTGVFPVNGIVSGTCNVNFDGYTYYVCNPVMFGFPSPAQPKEPNDSGCRDGDIATMMPPDDATITAVYPAETRWFISTTNLSQVQKRKI